MKAVFINPFGVLFNLPASESVRMKCFTEINYCKTVLRNNPGEFALVDWAKEFEKQLRDNSVKIVNITNAYKRDVVKTILEYQKLSSSFIYSIHDDYHHTFETIKDYCCLKNEDIVIVSKRGEDINYAKEHNISYVDMNKNSLLDAWAYIKSLLQ